MHHRGVENMAPVVFLQEFIVDIVGLYQLHRCVDGLLEQLRVFKQVGQFQLSAVLKFSVVAHHGDDIWQFPRLAFALFRRFFSMGPQPFINGQECIEV